MQTGTERLLVMDDDEALRILFKAVLTSSVTMCRLPATELRPSLL
jgi:hypothetical protein